jgi:hypothetical protein
MISGRTVTRSISAKPVPSRAWNCGLVDGALVARGQYPIAEIVALERGRRLIPATTLRSLIQAFERQDINFLPVFDPR